MLDLRLRHLKERLMTPLARRLGALPPTAVTLAGLALGLGAAGAAALGLEGPALALWLANRFCDGLDGTLARTNGQQTDLGCYLDLLSDLAVYVALPLGLAWAHPSPGTPWALALLLGSFYVNLGSWLILSALLEKRGRGEAARGHTTLVMPAGLVEGTETAVLFCLFLLLPAWLPALFGGMAALVFYTAAQRLAWARRHLQD